MHETTIRVRYKECDQMGVVHHTNYPVYFEIARTEMLRDMGGSYRKMEESGAFFVVVSLTCKYHKPAMYDDVLTVKTGFGKISRVKMELVYEIWRQTELLVTGSTVLATIDRSGKIIPLPEETVEQLQLKKE